MVPMVAVVVPYLYPVFNVWVEYPELLLLFLNACTSSQYLVRFALRVCPIYLNGQYKHFI
jgi:hypothetical protein